MPKLKKEKKRPEIIYPLVEVRLFHSDPLVMSQWERVENAEGSPLTGDVAKELLGALTEAEMKERIFESLSPEEKKKVKESKNVKLEKDIEPLFQLGGQDIYALNNLDNRPFSLTLAQDWKLEILRRKWKFNGEPLIIDEYGRVQDGQHRLAGLLLAIEEWKQDAKKAKTNQEWQELWPEEPWMEALVTLGIKGDDETVNTINTGKKRTLDDVLYRSEYFDGKPNSEKKTLAKITSWAIKLVWDRTDQKEASFAPRRPHSESMDFIARHERLLKAVRFIHDESGGNEKFGHFIPLGYAAGLMYLMGTAASDVEKYNEKNDESGLDFSLWDKAERFWVDVANNGKATEVLRELLLKIPESAGGSYNRDLRSGLVIKAWNAYSDGKKLTEELVDVETTLDEYQMPKLAESPKIGGIDIEYSPPQKEEKKAKESPKKPIPEAPTSTEPVEPGECPKGGDHDYIEDEDDGSVYCAKCFEPKTVQRKKGKK